MTSALASPQPRQAQVQARVAIVTWGSVPKRRLRAFPPLCCWCGAGAPFPAHSGLFPTSWHCRARSPLPALGAGSPGLTAVVSACSWIRVASLCLCLWADPGLLTAGAPGSTPFSLFPPPSNREGLCLIRNTQLYVNILPLLGVGCTHAPPTPGCSECIKEPGAKTTDPWF